MCRHGRFSFSVMSLGRAGAWVPLQARVEACLVRVVWCDVCPDSPCALSGTTDVGSSAIWPNALNAREDMVQWTGRWDWWQSRRQRWWETGNSINCLLHGFTVKTLGQYYEGVGRSSLGSDHFLYSSDNDFVVEVKHDKI